MALLPPLKSSGFPCLSKFMKIKLISIFLIIILLSFVFIPTSNALVTGNDLIKINGKTITKTTTIEQVNSMFGSPKIETESAFGGKGYSYYDDNYTYYLFLETNENGEIKSYGAIEGNFEAKKHQNGDIDDMRVSYLGGSVISDFDTNVIYGTIEYNCNSNDVNTYWENYKKDSSTYLYGLQKHSIAVSKVLAKRRGKEFPQTYADEEVFYTSEQLKYNGSSLYEYAENVGKTKAIYRISSNKNKTFYEDLPNPMYLGSKTENYSKPENFKYMLYDMNVTDYESSSKKANFDFLFVDPSFLDERESVTLTDEENSKLEAAKAEYENYTEKAEEINKIPGSFFEVEPQYSNLPLEAGKTKDIVLEAVTDFLNVARAGIGVRTLSLNKDIADAAQHKATLVVYNNSHGYEGSHFPDQPEGVSDEFYNKAQSYMNENLYGGDIQMSIVNALNDGYGDPVECGHRYNLLEPGYTEWGAGEAAGQGCHKFSGYESFDNELVAWPSNGIMPMDLINYSIGNWTARFYKNYSVTADTEVTIECLNTGATYEITKENANGNDKFLQTTGSRLITFRDDNLTYENGDVFKITLHNMKNDATGEIEDYTYRSVFYRFYDSGEETNVTDIELNKTNMELSMGASERILAKVVPDNASNKLMRFTSQNENIAKVRQDGTIIGVNSGTTTITVVCGMVTKTITVKVNEYLRGDINNDGRLTVADLTYGARKLGEGTLTEEEIKIKRGDVTGEGRYTVADLNRLSRYIGGVLENL